MAGPPSSAYTVLVHLAGHKHEHYQNCIRCGAILANDHWEPRGAEITWDAGVWVGDIYAVSTGRRIDPRTMYRITPGRELATNETFCTPDVEDSPEWEN